MKGAVHTMSRMLNKTSIITGAASGMGKEMALLFLEEGGNVIAADINQDRLDELTSEAKSKGLEVTTCICDISDEKQIDDTIKLAVDTYGGLDVMVNNAGIMDRFEPVADVTNKMWELIMKVDLYGAFYGMRAAAKVFLSQESGGVIVNNGSIGGIAGGRAGLAYTAAKHAMVGMTKNTAYMYSKSKPGIRCNMIAPGGTATNISESMGDMSDLPDLVKAGLEMNPRRAHPVEIARLALYLASDESSVINGAIIPADSGWTSY
jgi:NAD(P)-dependent dehydrogenase (short-subunit alcohol dehydrogenase family)